MIAPAADTLDRSTRGRRILVVDDEPMLRTMMTRVLRMHGYDVTVAANGEEALSLMGQHHYDLVLSDMVMPICDGRCLLRELRARGWDVPVVILTGYAETSDVALQALGAAAVLGKPAAVSEILAALAAALTN